MGIWNGILVYLGIRPCCDQQKLKRNCETVAYYEYQCTNCGYTYRGGGHTRPL